jgi:acyl carrier protein
MQPEQVDEAVREVFAAVLARPVQPGDDLARASEPAWDSLKHMEIMFGVEERCDVQFTHEELASLDRLRAVIDGVKRHLQA